MKNILVISEHLKNDKDARGRLYGLKVYDALVKTGIEITELKNHNKNVWCRDYLPVQGAGGRLIHFKYAPQYMTDTEKWRLRIPDSETIRKEFELFVETEITPCYDIILDGGAIEVYEDAAIISDRVFRDNPKQNESELLEKLKTVLGLKKINVIPQHPYDFTGHVDGLLRFVDADTVLINDLSGIKSFTKDDLKIPRNKITQQWYYSFMGAVLNSGYRIKKLIYTAESNTNNDKSAKGIYMNFLQYDNQILMPTFNDAKNDLEAKNRLEEVFKKKIIEIPATELAAEGGIINCVTWSN